MMIRGTGWRASATSNTSGRATTLVGGRLLGAPSLGTDYRPLILRKDQKQTDTCVGFALAQSYRARAMHLREHALAAGEPDPGMPFWPSVLAIYTGARLVERKLLLEAKSTRLIDQGCQPSLAYQAIMSIGLCRDDQWPFTPATINDEPDIEEFAAAGAHVVSGMYDVDPQSPGAENELAHLLDTGHFPVFGRKVGDTWFRYDGGVLQEVNDGTSGHMTMLCGHYPDGSLGKRVFHGVNSYFDPSDPTSEPWGEAGFFRCTIDYLRPAQDVAVITTTT